MSKNFRLGPRWRRGFSPELPRAISSQPNPGGLFFHFFEFFFFPIFLTFSTCSASRVKEERRRRAQIEAAQKTEKTNRKKNVNSNNKNVILTDKIGNRIAAAAHLKENNVNFFAFFSKTGHNVSPVFTCNFDSICMGTRVVLKYAGLTQFNHCSFPNPDVFTRGGEIVFFVPHSKHCFHSFVSFLAPKKDQLERNDKEPKGILRTEIGEARGVGELWSSLLRVRGGVGLPPNAAARLRGWTTNAVARPRDWTTGMHTPRSKWGESTFPGKRH